MGAKKLILMSGRFILDTNIVIAIFGGETSIKEHLSKADEVFISRVLSSLRLLKRKRYF